MTHDMVKDAPDLKKILEPALSAAEWEAYDEWSEKCAKIQEEEEARIFVPGVLTLPFRTIGREPPPTNWTEEVWVWEDEDWEGGAGIGWHRTNMYGGYGPEDAGCNWWQEPVCGRCGGNPYWIPGSAKEGSLPGMSPESIAMQSLKALEDEVSRRVKERSPPYEGKVPNFYDQMAHSSLKMGRRMAAVLENKTKPDQREEKP